MQGFSIMIQGSLYSDVMCGERHAKNEVSNLKKTL